MDRELSKLKRARELDPEAENNQKAYERAKRRELPRRELLDDITMLFDPDFDAYLVTVLGLALGDLASKIPKELVTGGCPHPLIFSFDLNMDPNTEVMWIKKKGEADYRPYPPGEAYQDVMSSGSGSLSLEGPTGLHEVSLRLEGSVIKQISILEDLVSSLNIFNEEDMYDKWGRIDRYWRHDGECDFVIPKRHLTISWDDWRTESKSLTSVCLGKIPDELAPLISARNLILWSLEWRRANLPMRPSFHELDDADYVRFGRLSALFDALNIFEPDEVNLIEFFEGSIFENLWSILSEQLPGKLKDLNFDFDLSQYNHIISETDCRIFWVELYKLLFRLQAARGHIDGHFDEIRCHPLQTSLYNFREAIATKLEDEFEAVLQLMAFMIDPTENSYTWGYLVRNHHFPDEDLQNLDDDRPVHYEAERIRSRLGPFTDWEGNRSED